MIAPDTIWRPHIDQLRRSNVPLEGVPVRAPFTTTVTATHGSGTITAQDGTVPSSEAPQTSIPAC